MEKTQKNPKVANRMEKGKKVCEHSTPQDRDTIFQILKELPVKSLLRFRCVSKLWCSIIDDPDFIHFHHTRSHTRPGGTNILLLREQDERRHRSLYTTGLEGGPVVHLRALPYQERFLCFQSVNGLVFIDDMILNVSTRERKTLPPLSRTSLRETYDYILVGPNSWEIYSNCFLGFDPSSKKHKVLNMCFISAKRDFKNGFEEQFNRDGRKTLLECKILTIGGSWRDKVSVPHSLRRFKFAYNSLETTCCINGVIYCLGSIGEGTNYKNFILCFEVGHEKFRIIPFPDVPPEALGTGWFYSIQVKDHLAVINVDMTMIFILNDYKKQLWTTQHLIFPPQYEGYFKPVGAIHTGEILLKWCNNPPSKLFYYDLESNTLRVCELSNLRRDIYAREVNYNIYVESLVQLKRK